MPQPDFPTSLEDARSFDEADPLAASRPAFVLPEGETYLVGHSLGPATQQSLAALDLTGNREWAEGLVGSWNTADWIDLPQTVGRRIAKLIGAHSDEVIVCDSVSLNLFKLVGALLASGKTANRIIVEAGEFPTDQYILERLAEMTAAEFVRTAPGGAADALAQGGILVRSLVDYRSAAIAPIEEMELMAKRSGGAIVWDLSHATGVLNLKLVDWGAKYAVGCTYKYVNGGPGAPAFLYVHRDEVEALETPLAGWLGHARPFAFEDTYDAGAGMQRFVAGTPPILSMAALNGALGVFDEVSLADIEAKTQTLGDMCLSAFQRMGLDSVSPAIGVRRGGHVSLRHSDGYAVSRALAARGHKTDFRTPDTIRFGLSPLFLRYADVWATLETLEEILASESYREPRFQIRDKVT